MKKDLKLEIYLDGDEPAVRLMSGDVENGIPVAWATKFIEWSAEHEDRFWAVVFKDVATPLKNGDRVVSSKDGSAKKTRVARPYINEQQFTYGVFYQRSDGTVAYSDPRIMVRDAGDLRSTSLEVIADAAEEAGLGLEELAATVLKLAAVQRELAKTLPPLEDDASESPPVQSA